MATRLTLVVALLLAPLSAHAQESVAVPAVQSETDEVMAGLLTRALREAVIDADEVRGSGPVDYDWILRAEINRASADRSDRLNVSLRLVPQDASRHERRLETTMSPDEPPAHLRERARRFLDALFGTALVYRDVPVVTIASVFTEPEVHLDHPDDSEWQAIGAWSSVAVLAASIGVVIGTQVRLADIENDPRWVAARDSFVTGTDDICQANTRPGGASDAYIEDTCTEASQLETAWAAAMGLGVGSLAAAVVFFVLEATEEPDIHVGVNASLDRVDVGVSGRF